MPAIFRACQAFKIVCPPFFPIKIARQSAEFFYVKRIVTLLLAAFAAALARPSYGAEPIQAKPRILASIDETRLVTVPGNTHPLARAEFERGIAPSSLPMNRMLLVLKRSSEQDMALKQLISDQHKPLIRALSQMADSQRIWQAIWAGRERYSSDHRVAQRPWIPGFACFERR